MELDLAQEQAMGPDLETLFIYFFFRVVFLFGHRHGHMIYFWMFIFECSLYFR
jgi:hypothetical protein